MTDKCVWREDVDGNYDTACGNAFVLIDGTPKDNKMKFCCYCGKPLEQLRYWEPEEEAEDTRSQLQQIRDSNPRQSDIR